MAEHEHQRRHRIAYELRQAGYQVVEATDGADLLDLLHAWYYPGTHAAQVNVIVANEELFPDRVVLAREGAGAREALMTPVVWTGQHHGDGDGDDGQGVLAAVERLVGRRATRRAA